MVLYKNDVIQIIMGKMPMHPLNFRIVAIIPLNFYFANLLHELCKRANLILLLKN